MGRSVALGAALALVVAFTVVVWRLQRGEPLGEPTPREPASSPAAPPPLPPAESAERQPVPAPAVAPAPPPTTSTGTSSVDLHPEWKPVTVSVLDRATREDLKDVEFEVEPLGLGSHHPIDDSFERSNALRGDSPLAIPPKLAGTATSAFLVRAAGHATAVVDLDFETGGAREVLLDPACELRLRVDAPPGDEKLTVQLRRIEDALAWFDRRSRYFADCAKHDFDGSGAEAERLASKADELRRQRDRVESDPMLLARSVFEAPATWSRSIPRQAWISFSRLPPGEWIAVVVAERAVDVPRGAAGATLGIVPLAVRTIELSDAAPSRTRAVRGVVELAPGWSDATSTAVPDQLALHCDARLAGVPREVLERTITRLERDGDSLRFAWDAGELMVGAWTAELRQYGVVVPFTVVPSDESDPEPQEVRLAVGPPCDVVLSPVDVATRAPIACGVLQFATGSTRGSRFLRIVPPRDGVYRFRAPIGPLFVLLAVRDPVQNFELPQFATFELAPGSNALEFETHPRAWLHVVMKDGVAAVPCLSEECHLDAKRIEGEGAVVGWGSDRGRDVRWMLSSPGRYAVRIVDLRGFLDSDPVEVDVPPDVVTDVTIPLKRAR